MKTEGNMITDWLNENRNPEIDKQVEQEAKELYKQKTLEEAAKYYAHNYFEMHDTNNYKALKQGFEAGAKWQQEQMYSEEEVEYMFNTVVKQNSIDGVVTITNIDLFINSWRKQFKNK